MKPISKTLLFLSSFSLLCGCNNDGHVPCYTCYLGSMYLSSCKKNYSSILDHRILDKVTEEKENSPYYGEIHILEAGERADFFHNSKYTFSESEKKKNLSLDEKTLLVYFLVQIPQGYQGIKRNNIQGHIQDEDKEVLLTDNFYYYESNPKILYCEIDIQKEESIQKPYVFSFYFTISDDFTTLIKDSGIRLIYTLN